jgi:hypothetical protein
MRVSHACHLRAATAVFDTMADASGELIVVKIR